ncbi:RNA-directed DNA polymerase, eukaryota, reverse transcriptase zinc-binding domain protein [Tanacetum coccineum]
MNSLSPKVHKPEQSAFIKGRNILDGPLMLNEVMAWHRTRKKQLMIFKVDFEKAFDSLKWDFLDLVMEKLGFGIKWRSWIKGWLLHARASVLINVSPTNEFEISRGLRQSNPLSPFLFILAMEGLHAFICKAVNIDVEKTNYRLNTLGFLLAAIWLDVLVGILLFKKFLLDFLIGNPVFFLIELESLRNQFFIGSDLVEKKMSWVSWKKCLASKKVGGLGIGGYKEPLWPVRLEMEVLFGYGKKFRMRLLLNKLPSRVNLDRRGIDVPSILCPICHEDVETVNHTFFTCEVASNLWSLLAKWWEVDIPFCANIEDGFSWLDISSFSKKVRIFLEGAGGVLLWSIWCFRNVLVFSNIPPRKALLWDNVVS